MKVVILGSGRGSNAEAIMQAQQDRLLGKAHVVAVFSDKEDAGILDLAQKYGVEHRFIHPGQFKTKLEGEAEQTYIQAIKDKEADIIVLAGFMRVIKPPFLEAFNGQILNLHPSLLPSFKGLNAIKQAWDYGVKYTGCTVHWVNNDIDCGAIIDQAIVQIEEGESLQSLEAKVHQAEHLLLPQVIKNLSEKIQNKLVA